MSGVRCSSEVISDILEMIDKCDICHRVNYTLCGPDDLILMIKVPTCMVKTITCLASQGNLVIMKDVMT